jgi:hypothetical protein
MASRCCQLVARSTECMRDGGSAMGLSGKVRLPELANLKSEVHACSWRIPDTERVSQDTSSQAQFRAERAPPWARAGGCACSLFGRVVLHWSDTRSINRESVYGAQGAPLLDWSDWTWPAQSAWKNGDVTDYRWSTSVCISGRD